MAVLSGSLHIACHTSIDHQGSDFLPHRWTPEALQKIISFGPIIEIGAGHGHWKRALTECGGDVMAFDNESSLPVQGMPNVAEVLRGDEKEIKK